MPRKSMTDNKHSPVVRFRVDKDVQTILAELKAKNMNISKFIREKIKSKASIVDAEIIDKFFRFFSNPAVGGLIPYNLKDTLTSSLTSEEEERIKEIRSMMANE